jgi:hypothetical protein
MDKETEESLEEFRGWRFDAMSREQQLGRRVKELEASVERLERELRNHKLGAAWETQKQMPRSIGEMAGTIAVPPSEPYKAD